MEEGVKEGLWAQWIGLNEEYSETEGQKVGGADSKRINGKKEGGGFRGGG